MNRGAIPRVIPGVIPVIMLALVAASAISVSANGRGFRGHGRAHVSLAETLALTEDQQAEMASLRESFGEARQDLRESHRAAFREVLTEEQVATLDEIHESGARRRGARGSLVEALGLTDEQRETLAALREGAMVEKTALRDDRRAAFEGILSEEQLALLEEIRASRPAHGRHGRADEVDGGDIGDGGGFSTEAAALTTSATTAVEDRSWGQVKRGF